MQQEGRSHRPDKKEPEAFRVEKSDLGFSSCSFKYAYFSCLQLRKKHEKMHNTGFNIERHSEGHLSYVSSDIFNA